MKTASYLLASVAVVAFGMTLPTRAGEPLMSPRGKCNQIRVVAGTSAGEINLATLGPVGNAKAWALNHELRKPSSSSGSVDLANAPRPLMSPKDSRFETAWRQNAAKEFQVAPVK